jgi:two-component system CheB/CheR fusion protein
MYVFSKEDSQTLYFEVRALLITYGDSVCYAYVFKDQTVMKELEQKKEAENYQKCLIASVTHDLRTPLNGILGVAGGLEDFVQSAGRHLIFLIKNTGTMMLYLINDVLDFGQIQAKKLSIHPESFNIDNVINEVVELMKYNYLQKSIELKVHWQNEVPGMVKTDSKRYRQILLNLLGNSLKFTLEGSVDVFISYDPTSDMLITRVKDTGVGIKPEDIPKLFQLYGRLNNTERINTTGVGLGLHISKLLAELLGGSIFADLLFREGTTFTFFISCHFQEESIVEGKAVDEGYIRNFISATGPEEEKKESYSSINIDIINDDHCSPIVLLYSVPLLDLPH